MRNKAFEKLLKEAIILDAEEQGARIEPCSEPIPEAAQARFDAALNGNRKEPKRMIADASSEQPQPVKRAHRWLAYGLTAVSAAAVILVVVLLIGTGGLRGTKPAEPGEPLPHASATFADENAAIVAMMRFYEENRTLLMAVAADLKAPEHGAIDNGVVYPVKDNGFADLDHPYVSMTDAIHAFLDLPDSGDYNLWWDDSVFYVSLRWTNDSGYYSTQLVYAQDGQRIVKMMYEEQGVILEPVYEDSAWGVYTVCWRKEPYYHDSSYALGPETGVWETDDVPFLYLELLDNGTARILERFEDADIRVHYAWNMTSRNIVLLTFSDQTIVRTAELNTDTDTMTLTLADGSTIEATRVSYRLIVNGQEVPVDSVFREYAKGEVHLMIPVTALFRGIGCETEVNGDTVEIRRDGSLWLVLDLNAHTLINPDKPWYNYFTLAPGDTGNDFKRQRSGDELWVCTAYVENAFQILGIPERSYYDERNNEMRVTIGNTDG